MMTDTSLYSKLLSHKLSTNLGFLYENVVDQAIASSGRDLYYMTWPREHSTHAFEIDFLLAKGAKAVPIEVKSSRTKEHASLDAFISQYHALVSTPYIFSQKDPGKDWQITLCPLYLCSFLCE